MGAFRFRGLTNEDAAIPYGAHFCQVAVNRRTGEIRCRVLRPAGLRHPHQPGTGAGADYGGVMKALGHTLWRRCAWTERQGLNPILRTTRCHVGDLPPISQGDPRSHRRSFRTFGESPVLKSARTNAPPCRGHATRSASGYGTGITPRRSWCPWNHRTGGNMTRGYRKTDRKTRKLDTSGMTEGLHVTWEQS
jgi:putative selenate reductase molybdopterin-binding subunit